MSGNFVKGVAVVAVSYTHLDVYKRQVLKFIMIFQKVYRIYHLRKCERIQKALGLCYTCNKLKSLSLIHI